MRSIGAGQRPGLIGISRDAETVVVLRDGRARVLRVADGAELACSPSLPLAKTQHCLAVSNDAAYVLVGQGHHHFDRTQPQALLWNVRANTTRELEGFAEVRQVDFDPSSRYAMAQSRGPRAGIFDLETGGRVWWGVEMPRLSREGTHVLIQDEGWKVRRFPLADDTPVPVMVTDYAQPLGLGRDGSFAVFGHGDEQFLVRGSEQILHVRHPEGRHLRQWCDGTLLATRRGEDSLTIEILDVGELEPRARVVVRQPLEVAHALGETALVVHRDTDIAVWAYDELAGTVEA